MRRWVQLDRWRVWERTSTDKCLAKEAREGKVDQRGTNKKTYWRRTLTAEEPTHTCEDDTQLFQVRAEVLCEQFSEGYHALPLRHPNKQGPQGV